MTLTLLCGLLSQASLASPPPSGESPYLQVAAACFSEAWDDNGTPDDRLTGMLFTYGRYYTDRLALDVELPLLRVDQSGEDAVLGGVSAVAHWDVLRRGAATLFLDGGAGLSQSTRRVPMPNGTHFNFLLQLGAGASIPLSERHEAVLGCRWFHVSNSSIEGAARNPDIESLGGYLGIKRRF